MYCTSYSKPLFFPLPSIFGLCNWDSSVGGRKKHDLSPLALWLFFALFFASRSQAQKREKGISTLLCLTHTVMAFKISKSQSTIIHNTKPCIMYEENIMKKAEIDHHL
jgi:hypothetical protein